MAVLLELSDMFSTSTSNPICHISVFTAYLNTLNCVAVQQREAGTSYVGMYRPCLVVPDQAQLAGFLQDYKKAYMCLVSALADHQHTSTCLHLLLSDWQLNTQHLSKVL